MAALQLAERGRRVDLFEGRGDLRRGAFVPTRSINMTLSDRGVRVLRDIGLAEPVLDMSVPAYGRKVRHASGRTDFHAYGRGSREILHAVSRAELNAFFLDVVEAHPGIRLHFHHKLRYVDKRTGRLEFQHTQTEERATSEPDWVIGADGAFSTVRRFMHHKERADLRRAYLDWDYKQLTLPAADDGSYQIDPHALHFWPHGDCMMMAMPNRDGSFNCICSMPGTGDLSFESLNTPAAVDDFFRHRFPEPVALIPDLAEQFLKSPAATFLTLWTRPWSYGDRLVLVGDAAHTVVPFYGQGMIAGFEDCVLLCECLEAYPDDRERAFREYGAQRVDHTDLLADLSIQNFVDLRDTVRSPWFSARQQCEQILARVLPAWRSLYSLIAHTDLPYGEAKRLYDRQALIARWLGFDVLVSLFAAPAMLRNALSNAFTNGTRPPLRGAEDPVRGHPFEDRGPEGGARDPSADPAPGDAPDAEARAYLTTERIEHGN